MQEFSPEEQSMSGARRLAHYYRTRILDGTLSPGEKLPPTLQLAATFEMSTANVQRALLALVNEGLIRRMPHHGTIVCGSKLEFRCAAIIHYVDFEAGIPRYHRALTEALVEELHRRGYEAVTLYGDLRNPNSGHIREAIRNFGIQGIIPLSAPKEVFNWFKQVNLPIATDSETFRDCRIVFDLEDLARRGPRKLAELGCRKPGVLLSLPAELDEKGDSYSRYCCRVLRLLEEEFAAAGMRLTPERMFRFGSFRPISEKEYASAAYRAIRKMAALPDAPDGWFVYADVFTDGVVSALIDLGLQHQPLLLHSNSGIPRFLPLDRLEAVSNQRRMAEELVENLLHQFHGRRAEPQQLPFTFQFRSADCFPY